MSTPAPFGPLEQLDPVRLLADSAPSPAAKVVLRDREALRVGFDHVRASG